MRSYTVFAGISIVCIIAGMVGTISTLPIAANDEAALTLLDVDELNQLAPDASADTQRTARGLGLLLGKFGLGGGPGFGGGGHGLGGFGGLGFGGLHGLGGGLGFKPLFGNKFG